MIVKIRQMGFFLVLILVFVLSAEAGEPRKEVYSKHLSGEVSGISSNFVAILYGVDNERQTSMEMAFTIDKDAKVDGKKSLSEITPGDTVSVAYEETTQTDEKGYTRVKERVVKRITFIKRVPKEYEEAQAIEQAQSEAKAGQGE